MLNIPKSFFEEENRLGFYVPEAMKRNWAVQLTMLDEILKIADKHGIKVWLDYGSLLGAVRHHGYVPWDDDVDISVMRKDYLPLLRYLEKELPACREVKSIYTSSDWNQPKAVIHSRESIDIGNNPDEEAITAQQFGFPCQTFIDLYPMDYVPSDPSLWETVRNLYQIAHDLALDMDSYIATGEFNEYLSQLESLTGIHVKRDENIRTSIWQVAERISTMVTKKEADSIAWYPDVVTAPVPPSRPLNCYSKTLFIDYELLKVPIPYGYDTILKSVYGEQYYVPIKGTAIHDYPHFAYQEKVILSFSQLGQLGDIFL